MPDDDNGVFIWHTTEQRMAKGIALSHMDCLSVVGVDATADAAAPDQDISIGAGRAMDAMNLGSDSVEAETLVVVGQLVLTGC